jgi:hypothetical protein
VGLGEHDAVAPLADFVIRGVLDDLIRLAGAVFGSINAAGHVDELSARRADFQDPARKIPFGGARGNGKPMKIEP